MELGYSVFSSETIIFELVILGGKQTGENAAKCRTPSK
ncbi:hypothetical protein NTGHW29_650061 [Candidatus Nitrotoga sp. HW29]|nr:hypothetical protein NTGHW29_650061 [Candidatus Nitrotoga sp. HW29]